MIKSFTATTREIDDPEAAVAEITGALGLEKNLLKNSIGIISCFSEFDETGVLKAICDALPFDCIGSTTCLCAADKTVDQVILTIAVLTSDDCDFQTTVIPVTEQLANAADLAMSGLLAKSEEKPALLLGYFPLMNFVSGDNILAEIDRASRGIPLFGTMAADHHGDYHTASTIYNGATYREAVILCAVYGNPKFSFAVGSLNEEKIRKQKAIITESKGPILIGVNGKAALEYFEEIGLTKAELADGQGIVPLIVDYKDGAKPVARAVYGITPDGHTVCGGEMPEGAILGIGGVDKDDVLLTAEKTLTPFLEQDSFILIYSCLARYFVCSAHSTAEAEKIIETAGESSYLFACSGGEICPLPDANGKLKNYFHNYSIVFCKLG